MKTRSYFPDSGLELCLQEVQPHTHETLLTWIWLVTLAQSKQALHTDIVTKSSTWTNCPGPYYQRVIQCKASVLCCISSQLNCFYAAHDYLDFSFDWCTCASLCIYGSSAQSDWLFVNQSTSLCLCFHLSVPPPVCHLQYRSDSCQADFHSVCMCVLKALCLPCQTHWDRHRRDVMAILSDSAQIRHALTGLDCGWASKLPATIRDTSKRMGLTLQVISQIKPAGGTHSPFTP